LGKNVIITNGSNIGNGVIAAACAVITKDVPDYAVVAGIPARIMKYRYSSAQIDKLNKIAWWDWSDETIRLCYNDFYEDIETFIKNIIRSDLNDNYNFTTVSEFSQKSILL
jgi:Acetyltransferase (isoleucine patch superfamily)